MLQIKEHSIKRNENEVIITLTAERIHGQEFKAEVSFEIDGRDFEVEMLEGDYPYEFDDEFADDLYDSEEWPEIEKAMSVS